VGLDPNRLDLSPGNVECNDGWFVEDDAAPFGVDAGIGGTEIDRHICCKGRHQAHENTTSFAGKERELIAAQFMIRSHYLSARNLKSFRDLCEAEHSRPGGGAGRLQS
jgi:hypothetical protein